jgi:hypothetical protein
MVGDAPALLVARFGAEMDISAPDGCVRCAPLVDTPRRPRVGAGMIARQTLERGTTTLPPF